MQVLVDYEGWRRWKDFSAKKKEEDAKLAKKAVKAAREEKPRHMLQLSHMEKTSSSDEKATSSGDG